MKIIDLGGVLGPFLLFLGVCFALFAGTSFERELDFLSSRALEGAVKEAKAHEFWGFNEAERKKWLLEKASGVSDGLWILEVGAGFEDHRALFAHCTYLNQEFRKGAPIEVNFRTPITDIPVPDGVFDVVLSTETLPHVLDPMGALREMARVLKPGGKLLLTAPYSCGVHGEPDHYYSGFTPYWYRHYLEKYGFEILEMSPNGGFFKMLGQENARVFWLFDRIRDRYDPETGEILEKLFGEFLPKFLISLDDVCLIEQFTVGYFIEARKRI